MHPYPPPVPFLFLHFAIVVVMYRLYLFLYVHDVPPGLQPFYRLPIKGHVAEVTCLFNREHDGQTRNSPPRWNKYGASWLPVQALALLFFFFRCVYVCCVSLCTASWVNVVVFVVIIFPNHDASTHCIYTHIYTLYTYIYKCIRSTNILHTKLSLSLGFQ